ncbi:MAG: hypothetical protein WAU36_16650 [Cyclobacteriaceae bacterium]
MCNLLYTPSPVVHSSVNFQHFDHLYKEIVLNGKEVAIIHIYSEYPNYEFEIEPHEGFTCVDDVARALVMLSKYLEQHGDDAKVLKQMKMLTEFVLQMQNENGYFNNFIWNDLSINKTYKTSVAELNWWSFRALWGLESVYPFLKSDKDLTDRIAVASERLMANIKRDIPTNNSVVEIVETIDVPSWLPQKYASDQSALLIIGLLKYYERTSDDAIKKLIGSLADGMMLMQKGDADRYPYGCFLSWQNLWHAWGNSQAYALLKAGQKLNNQEYIASAMLEIDHFYPYMLKNGFAEAFWTEKKEDDTYQEIKRNDYPQIVYGLRPMIWATSEAYHLTKDEKYLKLSTELASWLSGNNDANTKMYYPETGICFDGIKSAQQVSKNSGAESTIESLLTLLALEKLNEE